MFEINDLSAGYGDKLILKNLSLSCSDAEVHGILGWNGAGKTTLFNTIFGFLPPKKGQILYNNRPIEKEDVAYLETDNYFYPYLRGREYLQLMGGANNPLIQQWAEIFDLPLDNIVDTYSTGMGKKLAIAGIVLQDRPVLLLDEPFNGIDLESSEKMFFIIEKLKKSGKTILLSSHILHSLTTVCSKISVLQDGKFQKTYLPHQFNELGQSLKDDVHKKMEGMVLNQKQV